MFHLTNQQPYDCLSAVKGGEKNSQRFHMHLYFIWISRYPNCLWEEWESWEPLTGTRQPWSEICWGASSSQGACVICPYAPSLHNRLMPKQSSSNVFGAPSSRPAICKQSEAALFSHTPQVQVLAWSISSPFRHEMPQQSWKSSLLWGSLDGNLGLNFSTRFQH